jgi:glycosyltransferase involved in cell wall biosynthesis
VDNGYTGRLCPPDADALASAVIELATRPALRQEMAAAARTTATKRSWESSLLQLGSAYDRALVPRAEEARVAA